MIEDLKLVNRTYDSINQSPFQSSSDIDIDETGNFVRCTDYEGIELVALKAIITSLQLNGYGTDAVKILGKKNLTFLRGKLMADVVQSLSTVKKAQLKFLSSNPTYNRKAIVDKILAIKVDRTSNTGLQCMLSIQTLYDSLLNTSNTKTITTVI